MGILSSFKEFGFKEEKMDLYENAEQKAAKATAAKVEKTKEDIEADALFEKSYTCPVCDAKISCKKVRSGKLKLIGTDFLLRAKYEQLDPAKYGVIVCHSCGYAALDQFFSQITAPQQKLVKEGITPNYKDTPEPEECYSYDYALETHKLALLNAMVKKARNSEKAYICLKMAWLCQGKAETLPEDTPNRAEVLAEIEKDRKELIQNACEGFSKAMETEPFPMCGMDDMTVLYLVAALEMEIGEYEKAQKILSEVIVKAGGNSRLKNKALDLKEEIASRKK